jgi:hypothetical protein
LTGDICAPTLNVGNTIRIAGDSFRITAVTLGRYYVYAAGTFPSRFGQQRLL